MAKPITLPSDGDHTGRSFGEEEIAQLREVIESGTLTCTKGTKVKAFEQAFAQFVGADSCRAVASGTAACHTAIAAVDPEPGDEIITTAITDMGAITPILYQSGIPVFADVDPQTYNVTADTIEKKLTRRTKAVIVTHLFGNPCDMGPILELCKPRGIPVIEDCAQAYGTTYRGKHVGTIGDIGCFSLQQGKHMTTGEGGMVVSNDKDFARRMVLFSDKAWGYGDPKPDHYFLAPNYRMTELQGAVALAQIGKLPGMIQQRVDMAARLDEQLKGVPGVYAPKVTAGGKHTYWKYSIRVDPSVIQGGSVALGGLLKEQGIFCAPRYIVKPAFECQILREQRTFGNSRFPFVGEHRKDDPPVVYDPKDTPGTYEALANVVVIAWNEKYQAEHVDFIGEAIREAAQKLLG